MASKNTLPKRDTEEYYKLLDTVAGRIQIYKLDAEKQVAVYQKRLEAFEKAEEFVKTNPDLAEGLSNLRKLGVL